MLQSMAMKAFPCRSDLFDAMLEKAIGLCDAAQGSLFTIADGARHLVATRATPPVVALRRQEGPHRPELGTPLYSLSRASALSTLLICARAPLIKISPLFEKGWTPRTHEV
jgi:hypothetical protein